MSRPVLLSIVESRAHPDFCGLYDELGFDHQWVESQRKALSFIKSTPPAYIVAEFFYGYGNNYAGVNISNLDVLLYSLEKYAPYSRLIALVSKEEKQHAERLHELIPYHGMLIYPAAHHAMKSLLTSP